MTRTKAQVRADLRRNRTRRALKRTPGSATFDAAYLADHEKRTAIANEKAEARR